MMEVKIGSEFRPVVNTGGYGDEDLLSAVVVNQNTGTECADYTVGAFDQLVKVDNDNSGTTDGVATAGSKTITLASGNTLAKGDLFIRNNTGYRVVDASDTSITIDRELVADIDNEVDLNSRAELCSYEFPCTINEGGLWNVVISHPEMDDTILKYELVNATTKDLVEELATGGSRKMVATA